MVGCCQGASSLVLCSVRSSSLPLATRMLATSGAPVTAHVSAAEGSAQPLNPFFQQCCNHQCPLVGSLAMAKASSLESHLLAINHA